MDPRRFIFSTIFLPLLYVEVARISILTRRCSLITYGDDSPDGPGLNNLYPEGNCGEQGDVSLGGELMGDDIACVGRYGEREGIPESWWCGGEGVTVVALSLGLSIRR